MRSQRGWRCSQRLCGRWPDRGSRRRLLAALALHVPEVQVFTRRLGRKHAAPQQILGFFAACRTQLRLQKKESSHANVKAIWNVIDWSAIAARFETARHVHA